MFKEILTKEQVELLPLIKKFSADYSLVGGTSIALQIGHRRSLDFDLFSFKRLKRKQIKKIIEESGFSTSNIIYEAEEQMHIIINGIKTTFFQFPYEINASIDFERIISMPAIIDLAAMKAYALGGRAKWKDYVDLYFILKYYLPFNDIAVKAKELFNDFFNDKLFKEELSYFEDVNYDEEVEFIGEEVPKEEIKSFLISVATEKF